MSDKINKENKIGQKQQRREEPNSLPEAVNLDSDTNSEESNTTYKTGQEVEVKNEETREFLHATIKNAKFDGAGEENYDVVYDDDELEQQVPVSRIRPYNQGYNGNSAPNSPPYNPLSAPNSPQYTPNSPPYNPLSAPNSPQYAPNSPPYNPLSAPNSPQYSPNSPPYNPQSPIQIQIQTPPQSTISSNSSILEVEPPPKEESKEESKEGTSSSSETKKVSISDNSSSSSDSTRKITL
jgi:hypothetical protein